MDDIKKQLPISRSKRFFWLGFSVKSFGLFFAMLALFYVVTGSLLDRGFLKRDWDEKYGQVAGVTTTMLSVRFVGPPNAPVLTATPLCQNYAPYVHLSWTTDDQMDYFDIYRDGNPLISGIVTDFYDDHSVDILTDYIYDVTAFNGAGQATSNLVSVTSLDCGAPPLPDPTCEITRFDTINLAGFVGTPDTENRKPVFYGTSNLDYAIIEVMVTGATSMLSITGANENGYWTWSPPSNFNYGEHTIWVTAVDPGDSLRRMTDSLKFEIKKAEDTTDEEEDEEEESELPVLAPIVPRKPVPLPPGKETLLDLSTEVKNPKKIVYPGKNLSIETEIDVTGDATGEESELYYFIVDENYREIFRDSDRVVIDGDKVIHKELAIPGLMKPGKYKLLVSVRYRHMIFNAEDDFSLKEVPLINIGGGLTITTGQIMHSLLWIIIWSLLLLLVFLILLSIEYWISQNAIIEITEELLNKQGLITKIK
jgi:hypothetical protein